MAFRFKKERQAAEADLTGQREFSARLVLELARRPGNVFVSPFSAWSLLALLHPGARGKTRELLEEVVGVDEDSISGGMERVHELTSTKPEPRKFETLDLQGAPESFPESFSVKEKRFQLIVANGLWVQKGYGLKPGYVREVRERFRAQLKELDLAGDPAAACDTINAWANRNTHGRIREVLSPDEIDALTRLILANATYFKDKWVHQFETDDTQLKPFHRLEGGDVEVQMMHQVTHFLYFESQDLQAVKLPYLHSGLSMTIVLPRKMRKFEAGLTHESLDQLLTGPSEIELVFLGLPRYKYTSELQLVPTLSGLGLGSLFGKSADLSGISSERVRISTGSSRSPLCRSMRRAPRLLR